MLNVLEQGGIEMKFQYVNIVTKGCKGWLNLFIGEHVLCMVDNVHLAALVRAEIDAQEHLNSVDAIKPLDLGSNNMRNIYIIYGKDIDNGDFMPFHTQTGSLIKSEFWASYWTEEHKEEARNHSHLIFIPK